MVDTLNEEQRVMGMLEDVRALRIIDCITAALGREGTLEPGKIFPSLADITSDKDSDDDDDIDPRETFTQFAQMNARRITRPIRTRTSENGGIAKLNP